MPGSSEPRRIGGKVAGALMLAAASAALAYLGARVGTYAYADGGSMADFVVDPVSPIAADPFRIAAGDARVALTALACAAAPWLMLAMFGASRQKLGNEDTGREHGDDRLATVREMRASLDARHPANNVVYSQNTGLVVHPHDRRTRAAAEGRNLNACTFGISGLGKTFNLVKPNIMQACGDALVPRPYGVRNALARAAAPAARAARRRPARGSRPRASHPARGRDAGARRHAAQRSFMGSNAVALAEKVLRAREARARAREEARAIAGAGFDVVNTDPKGDNVRDVGWLLLAAGFDVKVFNTIDFSEGLHYNPLAYIGTQLVDVKDADEVAVTVRARAPESAMADAPTVEAAVEGLTRERRSSAVAAAEWALTARFELPTETVSLSEVERTPLTLDELGDLIAGMDPADPEYEKRCSQRDMKWMESDMGAHVVRSAQEGGTATYRLAAGSGCSKVAGAVESMRYRRSSGAISVEFQNNAHSPLPAEVVIELDEALVLTGIPCLTSGDVELPEGRGGAGGKLAWRIPAAAARPLGEGVDGHVAERLVLEVHVMPMKVADGVQLTKTVDCLCANLRGTDAASSGSEDPFWEDTKRLCFMSLIAFLFERYDERYHTLPEMMRLLDIALDSETRDPSVKSPLAVLMDMWERGVVYEDAPRTPGEGGGMVAGGRWARADNPPHSRASSMALHCYHAFMAGAPETVQSIVISCQAALVNLLSDDVKEMLSRDELHLETLGDAGQKQALFIVTKDTDSPFDFLTALVTFQAIDIAQEKAYRRYGGKLPRHVRFELDEVANIGKIPILVRAMAVVRSRNISVSLYLQSKAQLAMVYGEKEADVILDNCSAILFLGAQTKDTLEEMSAKAGTETVQSRMLSRSAQDFSLHGSASEQVSSNERRVMSSSQLARMTKGWMMVFLFNERAAYDHKFRTLEHPYYAYIDPGSPRRNWRMPPAVFAERFDYAKYRKGGYGRELGELARHRRQTAHRKE